MKTGWWRKVGLCTALVALATLAAGSGAGAQVDDADCRCVDADGNAIDNCACFVMPDLPDVPQVLAWGPGRDYSVAFRGMRPRLGVTVSTEQDDALDAQGAAVSDVMDGGPADEAGIREGDVITSVDGHSLFQPLPDDLEGDLDLDESIPVQRLLALVGDLEPGEDIEVAYLRDGQERTTTVSVEDLVGTWGNWARDFATRFEPRMEVFRQDMRPRLEEMREQVQEQRLRVDRNGDILRDLDISVYGGTARYGLRLTELTPGLGGYFGTDQGVLVTDVDEDSSLGLQPGDVILRVGDREVATPERVRRVLASYDAEEQVAFRVRRQGNEIDVMGRLPGVAETLRTGRDRGGGQVPTPFRIRERPFHRR